MKDNVVYDVVVARPPDAESCGKCVGDKEQAEEGV